VGKWELGVDACNENGNVDMIVVLSVQWDVADEVK
jgi:hypothetical protein